MKLIQESAVPRKSIWILRSLYLREIIFLLPYKKDKSTCVYSIIINIHHRLSYIHIGHIRFYDTVIPRSQVSKLFVVNVILFSNRQSAIHFGYVRDQGLKTKFIRKIQKYVLNFQNHRLSTQFTIKKSRILMSFPFYQPYLTGFNRGRNTSK